LIARRTPLAFAAALLAAAALTSAPRDAAAGTPLCSSLPNPVYLQVGDTQEPLMKALGQKLRASTVNPVTLIYYLNGSCTNINAMYAGTPLTTNPSYVPSQTDVPGWDPTQPSPTCTIDPAGVALDLANSNVFVSACTNTAAPAGIASFQGAIQPYVFVAPTASSQVGITGEEAYFVFGFGAADMVTPWNDPTFMFIRAATKSTLVSMAANIHVPATKWQGTVEASSTAVVTAVSTSTSAEKTIGILGAEIYDQNRSTLKSLAFRTFGQHFAYYPDSTSTARDKQNLRDGHYVIWSPTVYLGPTGAGGTLKNPLAQYVVNLITNQPATPTPDFDPLATVISVGLVPDCAMKVTRTVEGGDLALYSPAAPCGCFFESQVGAAPASCVACTSDASCNGGKCRYGYCEAM
jgi:hypothetical protein